MAAEIILTEESVTPATPSAGRTKLYYKTDSKLYQLDDTGTESLVGGASIGVAIALAIALG